MHKYSPSLIAATSVYLARKMLKQYPLWTTTLEHYTKFKEIHLQECFVDFQNLAVSVKNSRLQNIVLKYSTPNFGEVSSLNPLGEIDMEVLETSDV